MNKLTKLLVLSVIGLASQAGMASDGTITFNGSVVGTTCSIGPTSGTFTVTLPPVSTTALNGAGSVAGATPFYLDLSNCSGTLTNVKAYFEAGPNVDLATNNLKNTGNAGNVQVQLLNADGSQVLVGNPDTAQNGLSAQASQSATITNNAARLNYFAQYVAVGGAAGVGTVSATAVYSLIYN